MTDFQHMRQLALVLSLVASSLIGCGDRSEPTIAARTDVFAITEAELADWTPILEDKRELRDRLRKAEDRRRELLRIIATIRLVPPEYVALVPVGELEAAERDLEARQVRATYVNAVLRPQIEVTDEEVRQIFSEHRQNYQKSEAVRALEIFNWAPPDLPALRRQRMTELETLRARIASREDFEAAALAQSDATSAYKGGRIDTLQRDQVGGALEAALFSGADGLTDVVASGSGLHLFFVIDHLPPRTNELSDVADGIERTLVRQRLQRLMADDVARLRDEYDVRIIPANETDDGQPRLHLGNEVMTAEQLGVPAGLGDNAQMSRMERRGLTLLLDRELSRLGLVSQPPDPMDMAWIRYRLAWRRAVATELRQTAPGEEGAGRGSDRARKVELWTFDLLRIPAGDGDGAWHAAFRARQNLPPNAGLKELRLRLAGDHGLEGRITEFHGVTSREAGSLGPEIHTTIKKILVPGDLSAPLFLEDRGEVVVIRLHSKQDDPEGSAEASEQRARRRRHRAVEERLELDTLDRHGFHIHSN